MPQRASVLPEVPTMIDAGFPGLDASVWWSITTPRGTPPEVIRRLNTDLTKIMVAPEVRKSCGKLGGVPELSPPRRVMDMIRAQIPAMAKVLKAAAVKPE
jgi:tripartite-type tricarboxylate transporter receptor subunit TctC